MVTKWKKNLGKIRHFVHTFKDKGKKKIRPVGIGLVLNTEIEDQLALWVRDHRETGVPIPRLIFKLQAEALAGSAGITGLSAAVFGWNHFFADMNY